MNSDSNDIAFVIGYNSGYRLGLNHDENITKLTEWTDINKHIAINTFHLSESGCIVADEDNNYWSMGKNHYGECGVNEKLACIKQPQQITYFSENNIEIKQIYTTNTGYCTFWITSDNKVYGHGKNENYNLGIKEKNNKQQPTLIPSLHNIKQMCSSMNHSVAIDYDGNVFVTTGFKYKLTWRLKAFFKKNIVNIAAAAHHSLYVQSNNILWTLGDNKYGQLGCAEQQKRSYKITKFKDNGWQIKKICCGGYHNLLLDSNGCVWSWGKNNSYQCGLYGDNIRKPSLIELNDGVCVDIACGDRHSYILSDKNEHLLFGHNKYNQCSLISDCNYGQYVEIPMSVNAIIRKVTQGKTIKSVYLGNDNTIIVVGKRDGDGDGDYDCEIEEEEKCGYNNMCNGHVTLKEVLASNGNICNEVEYGPGYQSDQIQGCDEIKITPQSKMLLEQTINKSLREKKALEKQLNVHNNEYNELQNQYEGMKKELSKYESKCKALENEYDEFKNVKLKNEQLQNEMYKELHSDYEQLQNECNANKLALKEEKLNNNNNNNVSEEKYNDMTNKYKELENEYNQLQNEHNKLEEYSNAKYLRLENKNQKLSTQCNELNIKSDELNNKYNTLQTKNNTLKKEEHLKYDKLRQKYQKLRSKYDTMKDTNTKQASHLTDLNGKIKSNKKIKEKYDVLILKYKSSQESVKDLQMEIEEIENEYQELQEQNKEFEHKANAHETQMLKTHKEYKILKQQFNEYCSKYEIKMRQKEKNKNNLCLYSGIVPDEFQCRITYEIMSEPVITWNGITYEKTAIEEWFMQHDTSPNSGAVLENKVLIPNRALKYLIDEWKEKNVKPLKENNDD